MGKLKKANVLIFSVLLFIMVTSLFLAFILLDNKTDEVYADDNIRNTQNLNQKFDNSSILVVLDEEVSKVNKIHSKSFFGNIEIDFKWIMKMRRFNML